MFPTLIIVLIPCSHSKNYCHATVATLLFIGDILGHRYLFQESYKHLVGKFEKNKLVQGKLDFFLGLLTTASK